MTESATCPRGCEVWGDLELHIRYHEVKGEAVNNCTNPPHFPPHCGCPA